MWIVVDPEICHGKPVFKGTRILVSDVLEMIAAGMSIEEILKEYPQLSEEMIREAIEYAARLIRENIMSLRFLLHAVHVPKGAKDSEVAKIAKSTNSILLTRDSDFANTLMYPRTSSLGSFFLKHILRSQKT
ncbi:DUF5615 family PIN-like protein [Thermococcus barophilus]|uniref:DUF5615 domain-containing protein n=1 Tax=Thermococcus barophilus (strain DSM 11836 / MP) TaxID=391623 RepID=F0LJG8_THEBM|nr:DUF5615 family PIN-like protein [Thermococcus barophilus]ADT83434.1 hypothetical protein TERMP_00457 [Thermococcus barophilus MP]